ncbi:MAG: lysoplasmalogenase [Clostridia bacterium]|nr:lysoplasmalogenase [Clostridia bacterium]MBR0407018.1 lysoplasmalogenase [Clostridia bacterium]
MKWVWIVGCLALMIVQYLIYQSIKWGSEDHKWQEWFFKGSTTALSALLAMYGYFSQPSAIRLLIVVGLCVCVVADVILDRHFLAGTVAFGFAHLCYCAAMVSFNPPGVINVIVFLALAGLVFALYPTLKKLSGGKSVLPYVGYALIISAMLSMAVTQRKLCLGAALLFAVSDAMLLFRIVKNIPSKKYDYVCLGCYFLAQFLFAVATVI